MTATAAAAAPDFDPAIAYCLTSPSSGDEEILTLLASGNLGDSLIVPNINSNPAPAPAPAPTAPSPVPVDAIVVGDSPPPSPPSSQQQRLLKRLYQECKKAETIIVFSSPRADPAQEYTFAQRKTKQTKLEGFGGKPAPPSLHEAILAETNRACKLLNTTYGRAVADIDMLPSGVWSEKLEHLLAKMTLDVERFHEAELLCALCWAACRYHQRTKVVALIKALTPSEQVDANLHKTLTWLKGYSQHGAWLEFGWDPKERLMARAAFQSRPADQQGGTMPAHDFHSINLPKGKTPPTDLQEYFKQNLKPAYPKF